MGRCDGRSWRKRGSKPQWRKTFVHVNKPVYVCKNDPFVAAFPDLETRITCGIDFPQVPAIGCQWFSWKPLHDSLFAIDIAPSRTFCVHEEVERMREAGLIKGGSLDNAIVCRYLSVPSYCWNHFH